MREGFICKYIVVFFFLTCFCNVKYIIILFLYLVFYLKFFIYFYFMDKKIEGYVSIGVVSVYILSQQQGGFISQAIRVILDFIDQFYENMVEVKTGYYMKL